MLTYEFGPAKTCKREKERDGSLCPLAPEPIRLVYSLSATQLMSNATNRHIRACLFVFALTGLAVSAGCRNGQVEHQKDGAWMGFQPYAGARNLCEQWTAVLGSEKGELHWRSFAVKDDFDRVAAFYARRDSAAAEKTNDGSLMLQHDKGIILTIHRASATNYPKCDQAPRTGENTVIVLSQFLTAGKRPSPTPAP